MKIENLIYKKQKNIQLRIEELEKALNKSLDNTEELIKDSKILLDNNRFQRSFFISSIAEEEIGKSAHIKFTQLKILFGIPINWEEFWKIFYNHMSKREYMLTIEHIVGFLIGQKFEIDVGQMNLIKEHEKLESLYTDFYEYTTGKFLNPIDIIDREDARTKLVYVDDLYKRFSLATGKRKPTEEELKKEQEEIEELALLMERYKK